MGEGGLEVAETAAAAEVEPLADILHHAMAAGVEEFAAVEIRLHRDRDRLIDAVQPEAEDSSRRIVLNDGNGQRCQALGWHECHGD